MHWVLGFGFVFGVAGFIWFQSWWLDWVLDRYSHKSYGLLIWISPVLVVISIIVSLTIGAYS